MPELDILETLRSLDARHRGLTFVTRRGRNTVTFRELRDEIAACAAGYAGCGLEQADRAILIAAEHEEFVPLFLGALRAGVVPVPLSPPMLGAAAAFKETLKRIAATSGARAVVASGGMCRMFGPTITTVDWLPSEKVRNGGSKLPRPASHDSPAYIQFTSGSTSSPKGIPISYRQLAANVTAITRHLKLDPLRDRGVSWLPMYHDMGLVGFLLTPLLCQLPVWYLAPLVFARRPTAWCDLISEVGGSISFSPTFGYAAVADRATDDEVASWDLSSWRVAGCGGELVSPSMYERFAERTAPAGFSRRSFMPSYGLAEAVLAVTMGDLDVEPVVRRISREALQSGDVVDVPIGESAHEVMACGSTIAGVEVCITGSDGRLRGDDKEGAILVRGVSINTPEPAGAPTSEWLATGDVGFVSSSQLYLTGRTKNVVIVDGRNHHIEDVEAACARIAPVRRGNLVAFGVFDGDREALVVVFDPVRGAAVDDVAQKIRHEVWRMTGGVTPIVAPLPSDAFARTSSGKLKRHEIRSRYLELVATQ